MKNLKNLRSAVRPQAASADGARDGGGVAETIRRALAAAGIDATGPLKDVSRTIENALASAGLRKASPPVDRRAATIDVKAREVHPQAQAPQAREAARTPTAAEVPSDAGRFSTHSFSNAAGSRSYKLYIPAGYAASKQAPVPLVVMLHGCTQSPDDFATGTQMNQLADEHGFLVVYPEQAANANGSRCWNWFRAEDQQRDQGEPSLIAGITREIAARYAVDPRRIFVGGLSAGASMAVVLGATYPDLYAAIGAHSGLPHGAAHDMGSAFAAMQNGSAAASLHTWPHAAVATTGRSPGTAAVPTIVFHGDRDQTVAPRNGAQIVEQATAGGGLQSVVEQGGSPDRRFSRTIHRDRSGRNVVEHWVISGAGHAWSGGNPRGSYTDAAGPDASAEMIRFFLDQPIGGSA